MRADPARIAEAIAGRRRSRPVPPTDEEITRALVALRTHGESLVAPGVCIGCAEPYPCRWVRGAREVLDRAGRGP